MNTNVNLEAAVGVLLFLGTGFCLFVTSLVVLYGLAARRRGLASGALVALLLGAGLYLALLVAFSFSSREKVLARGEEKHFCEIDCHLAYSVSDVKRAKTLGSAPDAATARGTFYVVTVKTRFDETTTSPRRGDQPLTPNSRVAEVFDAQGRRYEPSVEGARALERAGGAGTPFTTPLRPGEAYTTQLVFDLPDDAAGARLLIREGETVTHFIVGHENSMMHAKTEFQLAPEGQTTTQSAALEPSQANTSQR